MTVASTSEFLQNYRAVWDRKAVLRAVYDDFYARIAGACGAGPTIEIGGGIGNLKHRLGEVFTTDIQFAPWLDLVADAQHLPFAPASVGNIVMVDVLHHLEFPARFLREAERVLKPQGRIVMVEPAITWGSTLFYRFLHHEPVRMTDQILAEGRPDPRRDPYEANQAIPTLLATRDRERFHELFPQLRLATVEWFSFASYALTGGFKPWSLISESGARRLLRIERPLEAAFGRLAAFRMMLVVEKM